LALVLAALASACASIWGFEDAIDAPDSPDARVDDGAVDDAAVDDAGLEGSNEPCAAICVPAPPAGWQGPLAIYEGTGGPPPPAPPACAGSYTSRVYDGLNAPNAPPSDCTCTCDPPLGITCDGPVLNLFSDPCTTHCGTPNQRITTTCTILGLGTCGGTHFVLDASSPTGGACAPSSTTALPDAGWTGNVRLCAMATGAPFVGVCDAGEICAPTTGLPFESAHCVAQAGTASCPAGYPVRHVYFASFSDSRGCTPCGCAPPTDASCGGGTVAFYNDTACTAPAFTATAPQACTNLGGPKGAKFSGATPSGASCAPDGGAPTGAFTPTTPTTICCTR
jgi:hypothetical protein